MRDHVAEPFARPRQIPERLEPGVNFVGFLEAESGLGEVARRLAAVLEASEVPLAAIPYRDTLGRQGHAVDLPLAEDAPYDTNLISLSADDLVRFAADVGTGFFARRYSIGVWFWETTVFRASDREATRFLDEIWVASEYVHQAIASQVDIPVHVVPIPIEPPPGPFRVRSDLDLSDRFMFLFVFDFWSAERKNPVAVVRAFTSAFEPDEGPVLVLKSINGQEWEPEQLERLRAAGGEREDIVVRDGYISGAERDSYVEACDCYVSLHRSEGLGLTMAEAMACGKPVIATAYSGNLEFMSEENSHLVPYRLVGVPETWWAHAPGARWAEPNVDVAARLMRSVWEHPEESRALGSRAREDILGRFSRKRTADFVGARLEAVRVSGAVTARTSTYDPRPPILGVAREVTAPIGDSLARSRGSGPTRVLRRLLLRAIWPQLEGQRRFEASVLDALTTLHRAVEDLERRVSQIEPRPASGIDQESPERPEASPPTRKRHTSRA